MRIGTFFTVDLVPKSYLDQNKKEMSVDLDTT